MSTDSELRAAAERLRDALNSDNYRSPILILADALELAKAYLAQRADDGELVTEDYLNSIGFLVNQFDDLIQSIQTPNGPLTTYATNDGRVWRIDDESVPIALRPQTRGQLRQLLSALGVQSGGDAG